MVIFVINDENGVIGVYVHHGDAIDDYNALVKRTCELGLKITNETGKHGDVLHETQFTDNGIVRLERHLIKGRLLQGL